MTSSDSLRTDPNRERPDVLVRMFALTDVGHTRDHNEDTFLVADLEAGEPIGFESEQVVELRPGQHGALFLVADGMGGAASGELASSMAGSCVLDSLKRSWTAQSSVSPDMFAAALRDATSHANERIHRFARENPEHRGMGTTATIAGLLDDHLYVAQVGDSRAYLVRNGSAIQLTKDQSLMQRLVEAGELTQEEAEVSERRNIILQALGPEPQVTIDLTHQQLRRGDTLLLCSDGLSGLVRANEIARYASGISDVRDLCQMLVDRANELGGPDNITVIAIRLEGDRLAESQSDDHIGHRAFPLEGTLSEESASTGSSSFRSDPTPPFGYRMPSRESLEAEFQAASDAEADAEFGATDAPADAPDTAHRKDRARPFVQLLAIVAVMVGAIVVWRMVARWAE